MPEIPEDYQPNEEMHVSEINKEEEIPVPTPLQGGAQPFSSPSSEIPSMPSPQTMGFDQMQSIVEEVIEEKWRDLLSGIGDIAAWKTQLVDDLEATKQELLRLEQRFDAVQAALIGKVNEYESSAKGLTSEMKALEKVFEKILEPLTSNIKELGRITEDLREKHHKK